MAGSNKSLTQQQQLEKLLYSTKPIKKWQVQNYDLNTLFYLMTRLHEELIHSRNKAKMFTVPLMPRSSSNEKYLKSRIEELEEQLASAQADAEYWQSKNS